MLRRFLADRTGAAALEFAMVAPLFFALLLSTLEMGWTMTKVMMLERSLDQTVRDLRIGRPTGFTHDYVKSLICGDSIVLTDCGKNLLVELIPVPLGTPFPADNAKCVDRGATSQPVVEFDPGKRSELVFVRACYVTDPLTPGLGIGLNLNWNVDDGYFIVAHSVFLNEPS
jgi:hypothetical protein